MREIEGIYFITVFVIKAAAKTSDFWRHYYPGSKNMKICNYHVSFGLFASINTISNSKNKPGGFNIYIL